MTQKIYTYEEMIVLGDSDVQEAKIELIQDIETNKRYMHKDVLHA